MLTGKRIAAPIPCSTRHATSMYSSYARPQSSEAAPKTTMPTSSVRRRPRMSPIRPPATISEAKETR